VNLPAQVPVMPLPRSILFPGALLPLTITENRYCRMLTDALSSHRLFCIGTIRDKPLIEPGENIYDVLGIGIIRVAIEKPDGSCNLILQGISRARIINFIDGKPYQRAHVELLTTKGNETNTVDALTVKVAELAVIRAKMDRTINEKTLKYLVTLRDPGTLSDLISFSLLDDWHDQQTILETLDIEIRLQKLVILLQKEIERHLTLKNLQKKMNRKKIDLN
jgi:ATP-dependent Lon protease